ncbi:MAG: cytochrome C [Pseudomonadota bacterium]
MNHLIQLPMRASLSFALSLLCACGGGASAPTAAVPVVASVPPVLVPVPVQPLAQQPNRTGAALTFNASGSIDLSNPFFKPLGNGRSCATCHGQADGWSVTPQGLQARFNASAGDDPVFRLIDGANSPLALAQTLDQKRLAYSMLLTKGVIRVGLAIPAAAEFTLVRADDPYGFASASELSLFRRPLPSANLKFAATVMWDGRETAADPNAAICILGAAPPQCFAALDVDLAKQANGAVRGHAQATTDLSAADQRLIVDFEKGLFIAQLSDNAAGDLTQAGALGGPARLANQDFYFGINDVFSGDYLTRAPFNRNAMTLFGAWRNLAPGTSSQDQARASIARGEGIFNNRPMNITQVPGFTQQQRGSCTSCHNAPNSGSHSVARMFNTGVSAALRRTPDMPLYTLKNSTTGDTLDTTDPGSAMVTGKWVDVGRFKTPNLRGASARAPFFHDGSAPDLESVVRFYDRRFQMGLSAQEANDLAAFLKAL